MDDIKLYNGDCLEIMGNEVKHFDLLLTDPPYYTPAQISSTRKTFRRSLANMAIFESWFGQFARKVEYTINPKGYLYIFCDGRSYPFLYALFYEMTSDCRCLVWDKKTSFNGYSWRKQHELIMFAKMPKAEKVLTGDGDIFTMRAVKADDRHHPAEKPVELLKKFILKNTKEGDVVFDPFMGSGSVGVAAKETGRKFIGIEISKDYFDMARQRINEGSDIKVLGFG